MLRKICLFLGLGSVFLLTACSTFGGKNGYFRDRTQSYVAATSVAPLSFPEGTEPQGIQNNYPIPDTTTSQEQTKPVNTLPPDLLSKK